MAVRKNVTAWKLARIIRCFDIFTLRCYNSQFPSNREPEIIQHRHCYDAGECRKIKVG